MLRRALPLLLLALPGCVLADARRNVDALAELATVRGQVAGVGSRTPVVVALLRRGDSGWTAYNVIALRGADPFVLRAEPGRYRVVAFEDLDGDALRDDGERAAEEARGELALAAGEQRADVVLTLGDAPVELPPLALGAAGVVAERLGDVLPLSDERFGPQAARLGLWQPLDFAVRWGIGLYALEPVDPARTPVVFVHGIDGYPRQLEPLARRLDRSRFQAWFFHYPSGARLDLMATALARALAHAQARLGARRVVVVAHSMGGLVARAALSQLVERGGGDLVRTFVTIATPWAGHAAAAVGVERSPVVVPVWLDMAPGSKFLELLPRGPLPPGLRHHLVFAFEGAQVSGRNGDGAVTLASQLDPAAQAGAASVLGVAAGHVEVLSSPALAARLAGLLRAEE